MSDSENESDADLDFSASEDEYVPSGDDVDSDNDTVSEESVGTEDEDEEEVKSTTIMKSKKVTQKRRVREATDGDDDSDSSVDDYLVNPSEIDLASDFFDPNKKTVHTNVPQFDCNVGLNLSDSDEEEIFEPVASTSQAAAVKLLDFNAHDNFHKELKNAKEQLQNFKSTNFGQMNGDDDVTKLLAIGEPSLVVAKKSQSQSKRKAVSNSSDESDFEEVENEVATEKKSDVEVRIGPEIKNKASKLQADIEASFKRKLNRRIKENQLMMHKVHLLSWIAYGNHINKILNSTKLMEMVVKFIPSERCYPTDQTDQKYFEQIIKWFKTTVGLKTKEQNCSLKCLPPIATSLALQIQSKMAICKKDFVFIFIVLLRSMGIQCRMVINFATVPIRPAAKDLCVISTKTAEKEKSSDKTEKKTTTKKGKESTDGKNEVKNGKSSSTKSKAQAKSITGKSSKISSKVPENSTQTKSLKGTTKQSTDDPINDKRKNLKRAVSVQSNSKVNDNNKRPRIDSTSKTSTSNGVQRSSSMTNKVSKLSQQPTKTSTASPISHRTRRGFARSSSVVTSTSHTVPQLDGGNDKRSKKQKADVFKIKFPLRSRSVSPSSLPMPTRPPAKTVAMVSPPRRGRAQSNMARIRLPSMSRTKSKSPTASTSEHNSRRTKFEKKKSDASLPSPTKLEQKNNTRKLIKKKSSSKSPTPTTSKAAIRTASLSPLKSATKAADKLTAPEGEQNKTSKTLKSKSQNSSTSKVSVKIDSSSSSPSKHQISPDKTLPSTKSNTRSISKDSSVSPTKVATISKKADPKTKSSSRTVASSSRTVASSSSLSTSNSIGSSKPVRTCKKPTENAKQLPKKLLKRKSTQSDETSDSDFAPTPKKKLSPEVAKPLPKQVEILKKRIDRRILSTDDESVEPSVKKDDMNYWIEVYCEAESKWLCIDLFKLKVNCVEEIKKSASKPIVYVFAWNNNNKIKDVSPRYCPQWNTTTRKLRVTSDWLDEALNRYKEPLSQRCVAEDRELEEIHSQTPIPTSISELKNHPLYVLKRHLLKFEAIYPPNPVPVGFIRDEPIYSRLCLHMLHSREIWVKQARVVNPGEEPYKIVKARPKWDRLANKMLEPQPLEIFGRWQTGPYIPPTAENGIVPRNAYGNVELFKPEMLPKKTVHLRLAGLNRTCSKLKIDCAQAVVGFDFHGGSSHPTFDGFVVCEEFAELVTERWCEEQEEAYRKSKEKQNQRIYDNWKKLIKGLLIRQRLQRKYNFADKEPSTATPKED